MMDDQGSRGGHRRYFVEIASIGAVVFLSLVALFRAMDLAVLQGDVLDYSTQSRAFWRADNHLPGYAFLIWLARGLTFGLVGDAALMQAVSLGAWCGSVYLVLRIAERVRPEAARWAAALYGLFPFVGVMYAAFPQSDSLVHLALAWGALCLLRRDLVKLPVALAVMLLVHKVLWPFAALMALAAWRRGMPAGRAALAGTPLAGFWLLVAAGGAGPLWIIHIDLNKNLQSWSGLPVLDGVLGTLAAGGARGLVKGGLLAGLLAGTAWMTWRLARRRDLEMLAMTVPMLGLLLALNQWEAWAAMRFAKALVIPLLALVPPAPALPRVMRSRAAYWAFVGLLAASQVAFAVRIADYFEARAGG
ncbi:MAG: hypothetical protein IT372_16230 [Polyangiaceae bacterium]|nr:hypothetical protein [Polyangiaceae bacterium]